jgi:hypothetical protein
MNKMFSSMWLYKMAWLRAFLYAYLVGFTTLQTSLNGLEWLAFNTTQRWMLVGGVVAAMVGSIIAFNDKRNFKLVSKAKPPSEIKP